MKIFDANEWFILVVGLVNYAALFILPKRFSRTQTLLTVLIGIYFVTLFDHTLCIAPFNFYDVNDTAYLDLWDILSYFMYGPFAYHFVYLYSTLRKTRSTYLLYLLCWTILSVTAEALSWHAGVYHYRNGYRMEYSLPVYLLVLSVTMIYYHYYFEIDKRR